MFDEKITKLIEDLGGYGVLGMGVIHSKEEKAVEEFSEFLNCDATAVMKAAMQGYIWFEVDDENTKGLIKVEVAGIDFLDKGNIKLLNQYNEEVAVTSDYCTLWYLDKSREY